MKSHKHEEFHQRQTFSRNQVIDAKNTGAVKTIFEVPKNVICGRFRWNLMHKEGTRDGGGGGEGFMKYIAAAIQGAIARTFDFIL